MKPVAVTVEIGGTKLQVAVGTPAGDIHMLRRGAVNPERGAPGILQWIERSVNALLNDSETRVHGEPAVIGVGFGGPVQSATGRVLTSHQIAGWKGVELKQWFEERFSMPAFVINDANAAGWGEYRRGAGRGTQNFCYMNIGSGIGGALILNGELYDGQGLGAGEIGHTYVPDWRILESGRADKLENLCSGWAIEKRLHALADLKPDSPLRQLCGGQPQTLTCAMLAEAALAGDSYAQEEIEHVAASVGLALANLITLFHPERIALGGGVSMMGEVLMGPIREHVANLVFGPFQRHYEIVPCALGESVVLVGSTLLALSAFG